MLPRTQAHVVTNLRGYYGKNAWLHLVGNMLGVKWHAREKISGRGGQASAFIHGTP
jgi:hypothetical protein